MSPARRLPKSRAKPFDPRHGAGRDPPAARVQDAACRRSAHRGAGALHLAAVFLLRGDDTGKPIYREIGSPVSPTASPPAQTSTLRGTSSPRVYRPLAEAEDIRGWPVNRASLEAGSRNSGRRRSEGSSFRGSCSHNRIKVLAGGASRRSPRRLNWNLELRTERTLGRSAS